MTLSNRVGRVVGVSLLVLLFVGVLSVRSFVPTQAEKAAAPDMATSALHGLGSPSALERANAVKALRVMADPATVPALVAQLGDADQAVGLYVAQALAEMAPTGTLPELRAALRSTDPNLRWRAAYVLGEKRDARAVTALGAMLRDADTLVQRQAADALAKIGTRPAYDAMAAVLGSPQASAVSVATAALEDAGEPAVPALAAVLGSNNPVARKNASMVLGYIGSPQARPALQLALVDPDAAVRAEAAWALNQIAGPAS